MPGRPSRWISRCCSGVMSRLSQTKPRLEDEPLAQFGGVEIGQDGGEELDRLVDVDHAARLGIERRHAHVGREHFAVAVEDVGTRGRNGVVGPTRCAAWLFEARPNMTSRAAITA